MSGRMLQNPDLMQKKAVRVNAWHPSQNLRAQYWSRVFPENVPVHP